MSQEEMFINGELLRVRRESRGWALSDMATRACMSVKQIRQLEEGGMSSFYSTAVKITSAKKVGTLLGLSAEEVFAQEAQASREPVADTPQVMLVDSDVTSQDDTLVEPTTAVRVDVQADVQTQSALAPASAALVEEPKAKASLWVIAGLFVAALAVAAYMQPKDESAVEAAPPLQVLPADVVDASSPASAAEVTASSAEALVLPASSVNTGASAPRVSAPASSAVATVMAVRPASAIVTTPAVSAASKAP